MGNVMTYDRISQDPGNFKALLDRQLSLAGDIRSGKVEVDQGVAEAKALFGAVKVLEIDLHSRAFEHRVARPELPRLPQASEQSGDAA